MVPKRCYHGDSESGTNGEGSAHESKRFKNANLRDVLGMLSVQDMVAKMEPFIRRVVREAAEQAVFHALQPSFRPPFNQNYDTSSSGGGRGFLLRFLNKPPPTIFTGGRIGDEYGSPIMIELLDANTNTRVTCGSLSSIKIEIVVLDADFGLDDQEDWTENQFNVNLIREREGRRPLVTGGDLSVALRAGVAQISDVAFTDNSSWQRSRKFRLGARAVSKACDGTRVREARSEAFVVKDHRGELYKKNHPPQLDDEVWRLEKIAKEGASHKKLAKEGIYTVRDFLRKYAVDPHKLRTVLGNGVSNKIWDTIIEHANECVADDKWFYYEAGQNVGLLFNSVYKVMGTFDGQAYEPLDELTPNYKAMVENIKRQAYKNANKFIPVNASDIVGPPRPLICPQIDSYQGPSVSVQPFEYPTVTGQDQQEMMIDFNNGDSINNQLEVVPMQQNTNEKYLFPFRSSFKLDDLFPGENLWASGGSQWPLVTTTNEQSSSQPQTSNWCGADNSSDHWGQGNTFIFSSGNEGEVGLFSSNHPTLVHMRKKAGWCKLRSAFMWRSVKRDIAAKKMFYV